MNFACFKSFIQTRHCCLFDEEQVSGICSTSNPAIKQTLFLLRIGRHFVGRESILAQYDKFQAGIVFGAENFCWPDTSLKPQVNTIPSWHCVSVENDFVTLMLIYAILSCARVHSSFVCLYETEKLGMSCKDGSEILLIIDNLNLSEVDVLFKL